jgi:signal transduction histidine kinase
MRFIYLIFLLSCSSVFAQQPIRPLLDRLQTEKGIDRIKTCLTISNLYILNEPDSAIYYCNEALRVADNLKDRHWQANVLLQIGKIRYTHHRDELARRSINEALAIFKDLDQPEFIALAYGELGVLDGQIKNIPAASADLGKAMKLYEDSHDTSGITQTYHELGNAYEQKGEDDKALTYYRRALAQYEHRTPKPASYFSLLEQLAHLYLKKGDSQTALQYLKEGVLNGNQSNLRDSQINMLDDEGELYQEKNENEHALLLYKQALQEAQKFNLPEEEIKALIDIADVLKKDKSAQSLLYLKNALSIAKSLHAPKLEASIYGAMAGVYKREKDYKEALRALDENRRLLDSLLYADTTHEIAALDSGYVLESSRKKIGRLQQITQQDKRVMYLGVMILLAVFIIAMLLWLYLRKAKRLNEALRSSNQIKDTLFSIIGHDLKGPAGSAVQLFTLMETEQFTESELREMLAELGKQTRASFELLTSLFEWGKTQLKGISVQPEYNGVKNMIQKNIDLLSRQAALKHIEIDEDVAADVSIFADANHLNFIIRNLISNAIKFSYDGGKIKIVAWKEERGVTLEVTDHGIGISTAHQQRFSQTNIPVSHGTGGEPGSGLGLMLIKEYVRANKGTIWLQSEIGKGTTFYCFFSNN